MAARRIGLALDRGLLETVRRRTTRHNREQIETLVLEYKLVIWRLAAPGGFEDTALIACHARLRGLLEQIAVAKWDGAGDIPEDHNGKNMRAVRRDETLDLGGRKST